ncbi:hypothetical protein GA0115246_110572 [Streptomyces sp. SolWspMP-sol7th]|nr:hypothetical protein GA0115246_110572 [Streptomyces sp. SolWspMP-sol7th]
MQELLARRDEVGGAGTDPLGVAHERQRALGHDVEQQLHVVHEDGRERFHALDGDALGDLAEQFVQLGVLLGEHGGAAAHFLGEEEFAAGRGPQPVLGDLQRALVGDLEVADLLDLVAPELDAERVLLRRREDVEDAASYGELAALLDQLHARVRGGGERFDDLLEIDALPLPQRDGFQVAEPLDLRLEHGADRRDDDGDGPGLGVVRLGVREAAQHGEAAADGVGAG